MLKSPFHPGMFLRQLIDEHELTQSRLARHLGVQVGVINQICNEKRGISAPMAVKLSAAFNNTPEFWLNLQTSYELGRALKARPRIKPLVRVA